MTLRGRAAREAAEARARMGEPRASLDGVKEGERITLVGRLNAAGVLCRRFEDGKNAAAATAAIQQEIGGARTWRAEASSRAERLTLTFGETTVEIAGPAEVVAGSREVWPGAGIHKLSDEAHRRIAMARADAAPEGPGPAVVLRSIRSGERVRATGVLQRGGGSIEASGYRRSSAAPWVLVAATSADKDSPIPPPLPIAFEGAPSVRGPLLAFLSGVREEKWLTLIAASVFCFVFVAGVAVFMVSRRPPRPEPARASAPKLPAGFGDAARCAELAKSYKAALDEASHCESDDQCEAELRGEVWFELDGCARFKSSVLSSSKPDAIAKQWAEGGCARDYEICSRIPEVMCRKGRCLEKPPSSVPDTWIRHDVVRSFSLYLPPDMVKQEVQGTDSVYRAWKSDRMSLSLDYGEWSDPLRISEGERSLVLEERHVEIGGWKARVIVRRRSDVPGFTAGVHFPKVPSCPPGVCLQGEETKLTVYASCKERSDCDAAVMAYRSIVFWEE